MSLFTDAELHYLTTERSGCDAGVAGGVSCRHGRP